MSNQEMLCGLALINGQWVASQAPTFQAVNPATGQVLEGSFHKAEQPLVNRSFDVAVEVFEQTRDLPGERWAELLEAIAEQIMALGDVLLERAEAETALPINPRLLGERARTVNQLKLFAQLLGEGSWVDAVIDLSIADRKPLPKPDVRRMYRPIGPVIIFDASNFPLAFGVCGGDTASAFAAGNPVLVKSHSSHPGTNELCAKAVLAALKQTKMPLGLFALMHGSGRDVGVAMVEHPAAQAVGFTGSLSGGRALFDVASSRPKPIPVYAEMGSLNPLILLPGAMAERAESIAQGLATSITLGAGQFCTKPGLVMVMNSPQTDEFIKNLARQLEAMQPFTMLSASMQQAFGRTTKGFSGASGIKVCVAGTSSGHATATVGLYEVEAKIWRQEQTLQHEAFGPAAVVVRCSDLDDLKATLATVGGSLTGSLHVGKTDDPALVREVASALEKLAGRVVFNGYPTGVEVCHAMVHGGPYPATTFANSTSVGTSAIRRFARPVCYQNVPDATLPPAVQNSNPRQIMRLIDGRYTRAAIGSMVS